MLICQFCHPLVHFVQKGKPIHALGRSIFKFVKELLELKGDFFVREACNILKVSVYTVLLQLVTLVLMGDA